MNMRQNPFVTDVTMTGTLFKLWETIRLHATDEGVYLMLRYLDTVLHSPQVVFEEGRYYEDLLLALVNEQSSPDIRSYAEKLRFHRAGEREHRTDAELVASTRDYNVVAVELAGNSGTTAQERTYLALSKAMGPIDVLREKVGERDLPPMVLRAKSVDEAIARAGTMERPEVELVGSLGSFNIVRSSRGYAAMAHSLGPTELYGESVGERDLAPVVFTALTYEALCAKISGEARPAAAAERLDALETQLQRQATAAYEAVASDRLQIDEIRTAIQDLRSGMDGISQQHRLVARQVSFLQDGPGDPRKPCLAGDHRGFTLVHYQGRVYGLRKPLDPDEVQWNDLEVAHDGANEVISGYSVDGVCARIDILEEARELHAELASLDEELLATDSRLTEGLRQANAALQASARDLERLARNWPNRFFRRFSK
jgi:hypothetical protein